MKISICKKNTFIVDNVVDESHLDKLEFKKCHSFKFDCDSRLVC